MYISLKCIVLNCYSVLNCLAPVPSHIWIHHYFIEYNLVIDHYISSMRWADQIHIKRYKVWLLFKISTLVWISPKTNPNTRICSGHLSWGHDPVNHCKDVERSEIREEENPGRLHPAGFCCGKLKFEPFERPHGTIYQIVQTGMQFELHWLGGPPTASLSSTPRYPFVLRRVLGMEEACRWKVGRRVYQGGEPFSGRRNLCFSCWQTLRWDKGRWGRTLDSTSCNTHGVILFSLLGQNSRHPKLKEGSFILLIVCRNFRQ